MRELDVPLFSEVVGPRCFAKFSKIITWIKKNHYSIVTRGLAQLTPFFAWVSSPPHCIFLNSCNIIQQIKNPTWQTSWPFSSVTNELNQRLPATNPTGAWHHWIPSHAPKPPPPSRCFLNQWKHALMRKKTHAARAARILESLSTRRFWPTDGNR